MSPFPYVPHELQIEILEKLPVKSLLRFKCVCQLWLSAIETPQFARKQLENSKISSNTPGDERIFIPIDSSGSYSFYSAHPSSWHARALQPPFKIPFRLLSFSIYRYLFPEDAQVCSCDGLVLLIQSTLETLFLWNPSTNKFKEIPHPPCSLKSNHGFGYDSSIQDYKIVRIKRHDLNQHEVLVYTLKTNSWRTVQTLPGCYVTLSAMKSVFIHGAVHFVCWHLELKKYQLLCFKLAEERFTHLTLPPLHTLTQNGLQVFGGCLHVHLQRLDRDYEVWSMKEYGNKDSWVRILHTPHSSRYIPYSLMENGDILVVEDNYLCVRDTRKKVNRKLIQNKSGFHCYAMSESLVTP